MHLDIFDKRTVQEDQRVLQIVLKPGFDQFSLFMMRIGFQGIHEL